MTSGPWPATSRPATRRSRAFLHDSNRTVVLQDVAALNTLEQVIAAEPPGVQELSINIDTGGLAARRMLARLAEESACLGPSRCRDRRSTGSNWLPGTDRLRGTCHCGADQRGGEDPAVMWQWLLAHPAHPHLAHPLAAKPVPHPGRHDAPRARTRPGRRRAVLPWPTASITLDLRDPAGATLPAWSPGAHIDLLLRPGLIRQFSLCGDPADLAGWRIAVLREPAGRGGSAYVHDAVGDGSRSGSAGHATTSGWQPADRYLFIAGGIGITPILPMLAAADAAGRPWTLTYGGRTAASMAFRADLLARVPGPGADPAPGPDRPARPGRASSAACSPARWCTAAGPRRCWMR